MVKNIKHQKGALMFELMIVLAVAGFVLGMQLKKDKLDIDQVSAKADGLMVAQVNNAIRKRIADEGSSMVAGTYTSVNWLHDLTCPGGLASKVYLPCHVSGEFHYDLTPVTTVTNNAGAVSASTNFGIMKTGTRTRIDLVSLAVLAANNENIQGETPIAGTFYSYEVDASGQLIASSSYDDGLDQWLRTDGGNSMKATLDLGGNQVKNLGAAVAGNACTGTGLIAQQGGAILSCEGGFWKKQGSDYWRDPVASYASLPAGDPVGTVRLTNDTGRAFRWSGGAWTALAVDQNGNFTIPGHTLIAGGSSRNYGALTVQGSKNGWSGLNFKDASGTNTGTLMMHSNGTKGFFNTADNNWDMRTDSLGNMTLGNQAGPVNGVTRGAINPGWAVETWGCSPNGSIAKAAYTIKGGWNYDGTTLSCVSGVWKKAKSELTCVTKALSGGNYHGQTLSCDAGYTMTGGGCGWRSDGNNAVVQSFPNGNGWYCADYDYALVPNIRVRCCK